jgi:hypothetical protein
MKKDSAKKITATATRTVLALTLVVVIIGSVAGFYFGLQIIKGYALQVAHTVADSSVSDKNFGQLGQLKQQLASGQILVAKADALFSTPATYQTQALKDISKYAAVSGITISSIDSAKPLTATASPAVGPVATPATTVAAPATPAADYSEVITIQSPVSYVKFLQFLDAIEGNLPKMQITGISVGRPKVVSGDQITTDKITITVSVR